MTGVYRFEDEDEDELEDEISDESTLNRLGKFLKQVRTGKAKDEPQRR